MSKGVCGVHGWSTKKSTMTKSESQTCSFHVKFNSA